MVKYWKRTFFEKQKLKYFFNVIRSVSIFGFDFKPTYTLTTKKRLWLQMMLFGQNLFGKIKQNRNWRCEMRHFFFANVWIIAARGQTFNLVNGLAVLLFRISKLIFSTREKKRMTKSILREHISQNEMNFGFLNVRKRMLVRGLDGIYRTTKRNEYQMEWKYFWAMVVHQQQ